MEVFPCTSRYANTKDSHLYQALCKHAFTPDSFLARIRIALLLLHALPFTELQRKQVLGLSIQFSLPAFGLVKQISNKQR